MPVTWLLIVTCVCALFTAMPVLWLLTVILAGPLRTVMPVLTSAVVILQGENCLKTSLSVPTAHLTSRVLLVTRCQPRALDCTSNNTSDLESQIIGSVCVPV